MGYVKGQVSFNKWNNRKGKLTRKEAMEAHCFICNGLESGSKNDCLGHDCPMYAYFAYRKPQSSRTAKTPILDV